MRYLPRLSPITSALVVFGGCLAVAGGCASKPSALIARASPAESAPRTTASSTPPTGASAGSSAGATAAPPHPAGGGAASDDHTAARTPDERRADLDKRLSDSLGSFDAQLRKEQEKLAQERDARQATVTTVAATVAATDGGGKPAAEPRSPGSGDLKSDKSAGAANGSVAGNGAAANEIPDGNDDDVVARRLRKAAEQETDPELKEKLWKEYVEYRKNTRGK